MVEDIYRILIVCKAFYPESSPRSFRATELAKEFARQGHDVTVLTNQRTYNYEEFLKNHPMNIESYGKLQFKVLTKSNIKFIGDLKRKFGRLLFMLFDYPDIEIMWMLKKTLRNYKNYDLLITIAVPHSIHWGTAWARTKNHSIAKVWVADCGDPYMGNKLESFKIPFYFSYLEKWFCRKTDFVSIPVETAKEGYYPKFHDKIKIIPQGFNFDDISIIRKDIHNKKIRFAYAGGIAISGVRSPIKLIEYLLKNYKDYEFHIYSTSNTDFLLPYIDKSKDRIISHPAISRKELLPLLAEMDFLVNFDNGTARNIPSKLIDYGLTCRPILNIDPLKPDASLIDAFLNGDYKHAYKIKDIDQYNIKNVTAEFLHLLASR